MPSRRIVFAVLLLLAACKPKAAPAVLNGGTPPGEPWFWVNYNTASDEEVANGVSLLAALPTVSGTTDSTPFQGTIANLAQSDLMAVPLTWAGDAATAPGLLVITQMDCTLDQIEPLLYDMQQGDIHSGDYVSYTRMYTSSLADYQARTTETITWTSTYSVSELGDGYTATVTGGLRRVADTMFGPVILAQTFMPSPANVTMETQGGGSFRQDYQIEVYFERTPGHVIHNFADWRDINIGAISSTSTLYQQIVLANDVTWDQDTVKDCGNTSFH